MNRLKLAEVILSDYMLPLKTKVMVQTHTPDKKIAAEDLLYKLEGILQQLVKDSVENATDKYSMQDIVRRLDKAFTDVESNLAKHNSKWSLSKGVIGKYGSVFNNTISIKDILTKYKQDTNIISLTADVRNSLTK